MISDITRTSKDIRCRSMPLSYLLVFVRYLIFVHAPLSYLVHVPFVHVPFVHVDCSITFFYVPSINRNTYVSPPLVSHGLMSDSSCKLYLDSHCISRAG